MKTNKITIFNGKKLKAGDCIELCDIIGDKYKQTKHKYAMAMGGKYYRIKD